MRRRHHFALINVDYASPAAHHPELNKDERYDFDIETRDQCHQDQTS